MKKVLGLGVGLFLCAACIAKELPPAIQAHELLLEAARAIENNAPEGAMRGVRVTGTPAPDRIRARREGKGQ